MGWLQRFFHPLDHKWEAAGVRMYRVTMKLTGCGEDKTVVLWRCPECGAVREEWIDGNWTLEEIKGKR